MNRRKGLLAALIGLIILLAWAPWVTENYAFDRVEEYLGGPDKVFLYLGEEMSISDVPKTLVKLPFVSLVYFPGEAMFIVTFWGGVF